MNKNTIEEVAFLTDDEILAFLKQQWDIPENENIQIIGTLYVHPIGSLGRYHCRINDIKSINGDLLEYPLSNLDSKDSISSNGIYVPYSFKDAIKNHINEGNEAIVRCKLELSVIKERQKHNNPMLLNADPKTVQLLTTINDKNIDVIKDAEGNILIKNSVVNYLKETHKQEIENSIINLKNEHLAIEKRIAEEIEKKRIEAESELKASKENLKNEIVELKKVKDNNEEVLSEFDTDYENLTESIKEKENKKSSLDESINILNKELEQLQNNKLKEEELMNNKLEKLRCFVEDKAEKLYNLGFIDKEERDELLMTPKEIEETENFLDFKNDFDGNYSEAISHIQAYLSEKNIKYPRYIIEDFFALIQTNDLIILAGESGSGKTNLVKSFADAVGGIVEIIPVKPNWTSSEDLLGYYNPLEKKYLSTKFLDILLEAIKYPDIPYFICLDEMNLARVEYYFADFLSLLEERKYQPKIPLYSDDESGHVLSEFKNVLEVIKFAKSIHNKNNLTSYIDILKDDKVNNELKRAFGFSDKDSLIKYHTDLRKMINGVLKIPASIDFPKNIRIIGTVNIDETTHYLSPKILDRAHIMKFDSPLLFDWEAIEDEIKTTKNIDKKIKFSIDDFGKRKDYPEFERESIFSKNIINFTQEYFNNLGIEVGLRTIRQGLNYMEIFSDINLDKSLAFNNFILHKILPKMAFDGSKKSGTIEKKDILAQFKVGLEGIINQKITEKQGIYAVAELDKMIEKAKENDWNVNYWA